MGKKKYTREQMIEIMRSVGKEHLSKGDVDRLTPMGSMTIIREFGSWKNALEAAGLLPGKITGRPMEQKISFSDKYSWRCMLGKMSKNIEENKHYATWEVGKRRHVVFFRKIRAGDIKTIKELMPCSFHYIGEDDVELLRRYFLIQRSRLPSVYLDLEKTLDLSGRRQKSIRQKYNRIERLGLKIEGDFRAIGDIEEFVDYWSDEYSTKYFRDLSAKNLHFFRNEWHRDCICIFIYGEKLLGYGVLSPPNRKGFSNYILGKALYNDLDIGGLSEFLDLSLYQKGWEVGVRYVNLGASFTKDLSSYKNKFAGRNEINEYEGKILEIK